MDGKERLRFLKMVNDLHDNTAGSVLQGRGEATRMGDLLFQ